VARCGPWQAVAITSHLKGESISIAGACIRFGRAGSGSDFDTDQSRIVYSDRILVSCHLSGALDLDLVLQLVHAFHDTGHA